MTEPQNAPASPPPPPTAPAPAPPAPAAPLQPPAAPAGRSAMSGMLASMSQAEMLIAGGAALIFFTGLVFVLFAGYYVSDLLWGSAAVALGAVLWHRRMPAAMAASYEWLLIGLSALIVLVALRSLVGDLVYIVTPPAGITVPRLIGMLGFYAGVALMAAGAWQLWSRRST